MISSLAGRPPRAVFVDYPLGNSAGRSFDRADQMSVVAGALAAFTQLDRPGQLLTLPNTWPDEDWKRDASSDDGDDTRQPRDTSPQFQSEADREAALASGALAG